MLAFLKRIFLFLVPFSLLFWLIHSQFESSIARSSQTAIAGFYSTDGLVFGLIIGFVIQRGWEIWTNLSESVQTEIDAIREVWKWVWYAKPALRDKAHKHLEGYISSIISEWHKGRETRRTKGVEEEIDNLRDMLSDLSVSVGPLDDQLQIAFANLIEARNRRLNFSNEHMPFILKRVLIFTDAVFILLSLFITLNNTYLDFLFTASIGLIAFTLIVVVDDLDNPFRPGTWEITTEGFEKLLKELTGGKEHVS